MGITDNEDGLLSRKQAATYLGLVPHTLAVWEWKGNYQLEPIRIGGRVRYRRSALDRYISNNLIGNGSATK